MDLPEENGTTDYELKCQILEEKNRKIQSEFNLQRAKLKELFLQKEAEYSKCLDSKLELQKELNDLKSQLLVTECKTENRIEILDRKAQEEIQSLQQLVQETIDESSLCKAEYEKCKDQNHLLKQAIIQLKDELQQKEESAGLAPVISHVKKLVGKFGSDFKEEEAPRGGDGKYDKEDAEVLRSLVVPLEEEIKALKEKIRSADIELQHLKTPTECLAVDTQDSMNKSTSMDFNCENCRLLEQKLAKQQEASEKLNTKLEGTKEDIQKEVTLRKDLEDQWQRKREEHKQAVELLKSQVECSDKSYQEMEKKFYETREYINKKLMKLTKDRELVNKRLEILQADNDYLSGKYLKTAEEMEMQMINLPQNVDELHELLLKQQSDLIHSRLGFEFEKRKCMEYFDEAQIQRDHFNDVSKEMKSLEKRYQHAVKSLEENDAAFKAKEQQFENVKDTLTLKESELNKQVSDMRVLIIELRGANEKLERTNFDSKNKLKNLQEDLSNSEHVQKDFVKLSQNLQMSLEKFRTADTEVRCADEDDVTNCPNCSVLFTVTERKLRCRHCCGIFCCKCLCRTVPSGPHRKPARVCDMCHTLLQPHTAPYFSQEVPHTPT